MKSLKPKAIIGLSTTVFLFLVLMSTFYLNDQVEYSVQAAEWELKQEYQLSTLSSAINNYNITFLDNKNVSLSNGTFTDSANFARTDYVQLINNSFIINTSEYLKFSAILWYDSSYNYLGWVGDGGYIGTNSNILNEKLSSDLSFIPNNANYFIILAVKVPTNDWYPDEILFSFFETLIIQYEIITSVDNDYYDIFENIRNNATTVNPLGFMNTIMSIPADAIGYFTRLTDFFRFDSRFASDIEEVSQKWWWPTFTLPMLGFGVD